MDTPGARDAYVDTLRYHRSLRGKGKDHVFEVVESLHRDVFATTDCLACANCCRSSPPIVTSTDTKRIAKRLTIPPKTFVRQYLIQDVDGSMMMNGVPCTFLQEDNTCSIYADRPEACRRYPHTDERDYAVRAKLNTDNTIVCPAAFEISNRLQRLLPL